MLRTQFLWCCIWLAPVGLTLGCLSSHEMAEQGVGHADEKHDDHDDHGDHDDHPQTHFEHDHHVPDHWPAGIGDAADKIEERLTRLDGQGVSAEERSAAAVELEELVSWLPEVAADTDLAEADWNPVYEACRKLETPLARFSDSGGSEFGSQTKQELSKLLEIARAAHSKIAQESGDDDSSAEETADA